MIEHEKEVGQNATMASTSEEAALEAAEMNEDIPHMATDGTAALHDAKAKMAAKDTTKEEKEAKHETYFLGYAPQKLEPLRAVKRDKTALMLTQRPNAWDPFTAMMGLTRDASQTSPRATR